MQKYVNPDIWAAVQFRVCLVLFQKSVLFEGQNTYVCCPMIRTSISLRENNV